MYRESQPSAPLRHIPFGGDYNDSVIFAEGYRMKPGESVISPYQLNVTPGLFEAMNIKLVRGRLFDGRDIAKAPGHHHR